MVKVSSMVPCEDCTGMDSGGFGRVPSKHHGKSNQGVKLGKFMLQRINHTFFCNDWQDRASQGKEEILSF